MNPRVSGRTHLFAAGAALCALALPNVASAELYRWVDERGIVNYSNITPPKSAAVKDLRKVEDRLSVYKPDQATLDMVKKIREQYQADPDRYLRERRARETTYVPVPIAPMSYSYDTCPPGDPRCGTSPYYYAAAPYGVGRGDMLFHPGFGGTGFGSTGYIAGLSGQVASTAIYPSVGPSPFIRRAPASLTRAGQWRGGHGGRGGRR